LSCETETRFLLADSSLGILALNLMIAIGCLETDNQ
jgi:hypothetical protein